MRKSTVYLIIGIVATAIVVAAVITITSYTRPYNVDSILELHRSDAEYSVLKIGYPLDETVFPPEIVAPTFIWEDTNAGSEVWLVTVEFQSGEDRIDVLARECRWTPDSKQWDVIKKLSSQARAKVTILGVKRGIRTKIVSAGEISITTSKDAVEAVCLSRSRGLRTTA